MTLAHTLIFSYLILLVMNKLTMKWASDVLDHRTAPIFVPVWILIGLVLAFPAFEETAMEGAELMMSSPLAIMWAVFKGILFFYYLGVIQRLRSLSLSTAHYTGPIGISLAALGAYFLGENLNMYQWLAMAGLGISGVFFSIKGHIQDVEGDGQKLFLYGIGFVALLIMNDHAGVSESNWYAYLFLSNAVTLAIVLLHKHPQDIWKKALFNSTAVIAGLVYVAHELVKYYQIVTITPATVLNAAGLAAGPIIMVLSAVIWKERTAKEQFLWGMFAVLLLVPLVLLK